jgi:hypothetical protein
VTHFRFRYETLCVEFGKKNWIFEFLSEKIPNFKKQNRLKQSPGSEVSILNFTVFKGFSEKAVIFCGKLFLILVFVQDLSQERCFLLEKLMALILKNS